MDKCEQCEDYIAVTRCEQCALAYCQECLERRHRKGANKRHSAFVDLKDSTKPVRKKTGVAADLEALLGPGAAQRRPPKPKPKAAAKPVKPVKPAKPVKPVKPAKPTSERPRAQTLPPRAAEEPASMRGYQSVRNRSPRRTLRTDMLADEEAEVLDILRSIGCNVEEMDLSATKGVDPPMKRESHTQDPIIDWVNALFEGWRLPLPPVAPFADGVLMVHILEALTGKALPRSDYAPNPTTSADSLCNLNVVWKWLESDNVDVSATASDFLYGDSVAIQSVLRSIKWHYGSTRQLSAPLNELVFVIDDERCQIVHPVANLVVMEKMYFQVQLGPTAFASYVVVMSDAHSDKAEFALQRVPSENAVFRAWIPCDLEHPGTMVVHAVARNGDTTAVAYLRTEFPGKRKKVLKSMRYASDEKKPGDRSERAGLVTPKPVTSATKRPVVRILLPDESHVSCALTPQLTAGDVCRKFLGKKGVMKKLGIDPDEKDDALRRYALYYSRTEEDTPTMLEDDSEVLTMLSIAGLAPREALLSLMELTATEAGSAESVAFIRGVSSSLERAIRPFSVVEVRHQGGEEVLCEDCLATGEHYCAACDVTYCEDCWSALHRKGALARHEKLSVGERPRTDSAGVFEFPPVNTHQVRRGDIAVRKAATETAMKRWVNCSVDVVTFESNPFGALNAGMLLVDSPPNQHLEGVWLPGAMLRFESFKSMRANFVFSLFSPDGSLQPWETTPGDDTITFKCDNSQSMMEWVKYFCEYGACPESSIFPLPKALEVFDQDDEDRPINILCLDGGGTRAMFQVGMLHEMSRQLGRDNIVDSFDLVCGVSSGGLVALLLGLPGEHVHDVHSIIQRMAAEILPDKMSPAINETLAKPLFHAGESIMNVEATEKFLRSVFGQLTLCDAGKTANAHVCVAATDLAEGTRNPFLFRSYDGGSSSLGTTLAPVARAAQCTGLVPHLLLGVEWADRKLVDGSVLHPNPFRIAFDEARALWPNRSMGAIVSLGSGADASPPGRATTSVQATSFNAECRRIADGAELSFAEYRSFAEAVGATNITAKHMFRFNPTFTRLPPYFETSHEKMDAMYGKGVEFVRQPLQRDALQRIAALLGLDGSG